MTGGTIHGLMLALERKIGLCVIEFWELIVRRKALLAMAFLAVGTELIVVRVLVAAVAVFEGNAFKALKISAISTFFRVTLEAIHGFVLARERECRFVVVKFCGGFELIIVVAFGAIVAQSGLVCIFMTSGTIRRHPQERVLALFEFGIGYVIGFVAGAAVHLCMFAGEGIPRLILVIEGLFIEAHHIEIAPVVIAMTRSTIFTFHRC